MNYLAEIAEGEFLRAFKDPNGTCRIVKDLPDGRKVILHLVDPKQDPKLAKVLRAKAEKSKSKALHLASAIEVAQRVGKYVFKSAMKKYRKEGD